MHANSIKYLYSVQFIEQREWTHCGRECVNCKLRRVQFPSTGLHFSSTCGRPSPKFANFCDPAELSYFLSIAVCEMMVLSFRRPEPETYIPLCLANVFNNARRFLVRPRNFPSVRAPEKILGVGEFRNRDRSSDDGQLRIWVYLFFVENLSANFHGTGA